MMNMDNIQVLYNNRQYTRVDKHDFTKLVYKDKKRHIKK